MDVYIKNTGDVTYFKGFPIISESQRSTAIGWSGEREPIEFPDELLNLCVDGVEDRMNNKIFKLYTLHKIDGELCRIYFDMYADAMLDVLQNGTVSEGIIKSPVVVIARSKLVIKDGELHKDYLKNVAFRKMKPISMKDLEIGKVYAKGDAPDNNMYLYLGRIKNMGHLIIHLYRSWKNPSVIEMSTSSYYNKVTSSPGFKFKNDENIVISKSQVLNALSTLISGKNNTLKSEEKTLEEYLKGHGRYGWYSTDSAKIRIEEIKEDIIKWEKVIEYVKSLDID